MERTTRVKKRYFEHAFVGVFSSLIVAPMFVIGAGYVDDTTTKIFSIARLATERAIERINTDLAPSFPNQQIRVLDGNLMPTSQLAVVIKSESLNTDSVEQHGFVRRVINSIRVFFSSLFSISETQIISTENKAQPSIPTQTQIQTQVQTTDISNPTPPTAPIRERVVERIIERTVLSPTPTPVLIAGVSESTIDEKLIQLSNALKAEIYRVDEIASRQWNWSSGLATIAITQSNDKLANVTISNSTISGSTISNTTISGSTFSGALGNIADFTTNNFNTTNSTSTNATSTNLYSTNIFGANSNITNSTSTNSFATTASSTSLFSQFASIVGLNVVNSTTTSATSTNFYSSNIFGVNSDITNSTSTSLFSATATVTDFLATNATTTSATSTNLYSTNIFGANSNITNSTSTNSFATTASSTSLFSQFASIVGLNVVNSTTTSATSTNFYSSNIFGVNSDITNSTSTSLFSATATVTDFLATNATTTSATSTNFYSTNIFGANSNITNSTSTNSFATTASSTNLFTSNFSLGSISGFLKATAGAVTNALVNLTTDITGILGIANGGTNNSSFSTGALTYFDGTRLTSTSSPIVGYITATSTTATSTFAGGLTAGTNGLTVLQSGNVGVGTTAPGYPLVVQTSGTGTTVNSNIIARLQANGTGYASTLQFSDNVTYAASISMINGDFNFLVPGFGIVPSMVVKATTGNVGIGTTTPASKLSVYTTEMTPAGSENFLVNFINLDPNAGDGNSLLVQGGANSSTGETFEVRDYVGNTDFVIKGDGNVGIGTTGPGYKLDVAGGTNATARFYDQTATTGLTRVDILSGAGQTTTPLLNLSSASDIGAVQRFNSYVYASGDTGGAIQWWQLYGGSVGILNYVQSEWDTGKRAALTFGVRNADTGNATEAMRIASTGNVGIGTTAPTSNLEINAGSATLAKDILTVKGGGSSGAYGFLVESNSGQDIFKVDTLTYNVTMNTTGSGNVGIGTTNPINKLSIWGLSSDGSGSTGNVLEVGGPSGTNGFQAGANDAGNYAWIQTKSADPLALNPNGGNVGIGTTTPGYKLDVWGTVGIRPNGGSYNTHYFTTGASNEANYIQYNASGVATNNIRTDAASYFNGGNVGIGTTGPTFKLTVNGGGTVPTTVADSQFPLFVSNTSSISPVTRIAIVSGSTGSTGQAILNFGDADLAYSGGISYDNSNNSMAFRTLDTEWVRILNNGNVGIGTPSPARRFSIFETSANPQFRSSYDATNYTELTVNAVGDLTISATGGDVGFYNENIRVCAGGACPTDPLGLVGQGNILAEGAIFADALNPATCPAGMISVPASPSDGKQGFCVDKYEVKSVGGVATSQASGSPWVSVAQYDARAACIVAGKHLVTEPEWMAIAHNIENVGWNWNGGVVGTNQMSDGHSDGTPGSALEADVTGDADDDPCVGTLQSCSLTTWNSQRRTYKLSNGEYIWDFGGDVWEWTDAINHDDYPILNSSVAGWQVCATTGDGICGNIKTTNDQWYRGGTVAARGFLRGGTWDGGAYSGAFTLNLGNAPSGVSTSIGFRCAR